MIALHGCSPSGSMVASTPTPTCARVGEMHFDELTQGGQMELEFTRAATRFITSTKYSSGSTPGNAHVSISDSTTAPLVRADRSP